MAQVARDVEAMDLVTKGVETAGQNERPAGLQLGDFTETLIAFILRLTTPRDVARLACVSTTFLAASNSGLVWEAMLPPAYADILAQVPNAPDPSTCSKREVYDFLCSCRRILLQNGSRDYWLDRATGGICQSMGARGLALNCGYNDRYLDWGKRRKGSRFTEVACLKLVLWQEAQGRLQCFLSPGIYTLSWRVFYQEALIGPVKFFLEATGGEQVKTVCYLTPRGPRTWRGWPKEEQKSIGCRWDRHKWMELDVGEFVVRSKDLPVEVKFSMVGLESRFESSGLCLDGVVIRPSHLVPPSDVSSEGQGAGETNDDWIDFDPLWRKAKRNRWPHN